MSQWSAMIPSSGIDIFANGPSLAPVEDLYDAVQHVFVGKRAGGEAF